MSFHNYTRPIVTSFMIYNLDIRTTFNMVGPPSAVYLEWVSADL